MGGEPVSELVRAVHLALNGTAVPRTPDSALLPPPDTGAGTLLGDPARLGGGIDDLFRRRRSGYSFGAVQPTPAQVAALLRVGIGTAPRAGGLTAVRPHLVVRGRGRLGLGVHRADLRLPLPHLAPVRAGDPTAYLAQSLDQPSFAARVPLWIALAVDLTQHTRRYPDRHYRTLHLDCGAAMQNVLLVATALGLTVCPVMGYDDAAWHELLGLDEHGIIAGIIATG